MKNKIIILLIFLVPLTVFAFLEYLTKDYSSQALAGDEKMDKSTVIKFYSPMCSECKTVQKNLDSAIEPYYEYITLEEVNVSDKNKKNKKMIETYKVTVVPTIVYINKSGDVVEKTEGMTEEIEIKNNLDKIK